MKIAIPTDSGKVAGHFGRAPEFTMVTIKDGEVTEKREIENPGHKPGYLPKFFNKKEIDLMITSGIGRRAISLFEEFDVNVISGAKGEVEEVINKYLKGKLEESSNPCKPGKGKDYGVEKVD